MKQKEAIQIIGADISTSNSKMPGASFGLSATCCNVGGKLQKVCGSVCHNCYALRLEKMRPDVHNGYMKRTSKIHKAMSDPIHREKWISAMVERIKRKTKPEDPHFRWHDSGDLQGFEHLCMIVEVAEKLPNIHFWLPTKEQGIIRKYLKTKGKFPKNLTVRVSGTMINGKPPKINGLPTSTVYDKHGTPTGFDCPAYKQGNKCMDCRACWDKTVANISYKKH